MQVREARSHVSLMKSTLCVTGYYTSNCSCHLLSIFNIFHISVVEQAVFQDGESVGEPKFKISWSKVHKTFRARPVAVEKDYGYMMPMVAHVLSSVSESNLGMDMRVNPTHMAPQERPSRSQIIFQTQHFSRFK